MQFTEFLGSPVVRTLLSLPRAQVQSLVRKLKSHKPDSVAKINESKNTETENKTQKNGKLFNMYLFIFLKGCGELRTAPTPGLSWRY